jgi:hypothetical protein
MTKRKRKPITVFLSCDGVTKTNIWMPEPTSDMAKISFKCKEKKRKAIVERKREEEECHKNQQNAYIQN